jgi:predicted alpha/beta hydrolase family esterase
MAKGKVVIVHGYRGKPEQGWLGWLAAELTERGYEVVNPQMPDRRNPVVGDWVKVLRDSIGKLDKQTVIIGHSMGCNVSLRYLSELADGKSLLGYATRSLFRQKPARFAGLIMVSGFYATPGDKLYNYFGPVPNFGLIKQMTSRRLCIYSDNDRVVKPEQSLALAAALDAETMELNDRGHLMYTDRKEHPEILAAILDCLK